MPTLLTSLMILSLALVPALLWIKVYRYLDNRDQEPMKATIFAFLVGILTTLPVFLLQYLFSQFPEFDLLSLLKRNISSPLIFSSFFLMFVAVIEETLKALGFLFVVRKYSKAFNQIVDGIVYASLIGLGFALAENIYYFTRALEAFQLSGNFLAVFSIRSFGTMLAHTLFVGVFGFYFAKAYFSPIIPKAKAQEKPWADLRKNLKKSLRLHEAFFHMMPTSKKDDRPIERNVLVLQGFFIAVLLHFLYNAMIKLEVFGQNWTFLIVPLIFIMAWYLWSRFFVWIYNRILDFIRVRKGWYKVRIR